MASLSRDQIAALAKGAGFAGKDVDIAVAVALAESGGNPSAHNPNPPDDSYGLWQINMLGSLGPDRRKRFGLSGNKDLYDPATNARVAYGIWKGNGWSAWTTYTRGTYKKYLTDSGEPTDPGSDSGISLNPINGVSSAINSFGENFLKGFASIGAVLLAVVMLALGVVILMRSQTADVAKVAKLVAG